MAAPADASTGGLSPASVGAQSGGKRSAWLKHVMSVKKAHPKMSLGDAMKEAKKTYKKTGGQLAGKSGPMGGGRRTKKNGRKGGALYGFGGDLADGGMRYGTAGDATWKGSSELTGAPASGAPAAGGRRTRRRHRRRNNKKGTASGGKRRR